MSRILAMNEAEQALWELVARRCEPGADKGAVDAAIWDRFGETRTVMFTDLSGFSRSVAAFGIIHFLQVIFEHKGLVLPVVEAHGGDVVKIEADSLLLLFPSPQAAMQAAMEMQWACQAHSRNRTPEEKVLLCLGIGHGPILNLGGADIYGQQVNAASKLGEDTAKAHEILITDTVKEALADFSGLTFTLLDEAIPGSDVNWKVGYELRV